MNKIKITTASNVIIEKPIVSAFSNHVGSYVVLDNEQTGSMGLPIILVSKISENTLSKIEDQAEWQNAKESLKTIISGQKIDYINLAAEMNATDNYFNQLTLPVNSFEALKSNYNNWVVENAPKVEEVAQEVAAPVVPEPVTIAASESVPVSTVASAPVEQAVPVENPEVVQASPVQPVAQEVTPAVEIPAIEPVVTVEPVVNVDVQPTVPAPEMPAQPTVEAPTVQVETPAAVDIPSVSVSESAIPDFPAIDPINDSVISEEPVTGGENIVMTPETMEELKKTWLVSCENLFDSLVKKLNNK